MSQSFAIMKEYSKTPMKKQVHGPIYINPLGICGMSFWSLCICNFVSLENKNNISVVK